MIRRGTPGIGVIALIAAMLVVQFPAQAEQLVAAFRSGTERVATRLGVTDDAQPTAQPPIAAPTGPAAVQVAGHHLTIAAYDDVAAATYDRDHWPHWNDPDGNGCHARQDILIRDATTPASTTSDCTVVAGTWISPYDGHTFTDPADLDIDHIVPLKNAQASGAAHWDHDQRSQFANDPANLIAASAATNRSRGDNSPDQWRPGHCATSAPGWCDEPTVEFKNQQFTPRYWCELSTRYAAVKATYQLTVTEPEAHALAEMQTYC